MHDISKDRQLTEILTTLFNGNLDDEKLKQIYEQMREICESKENQARLHYSVISKFVNDMYVKHGKNMILADGYTKIDVTIEALAMLEKFNMDANKNNFEIFLDKITDHLTMENARALTFLDYRKKIEDSEKKIFNLDGRIQKLNSSISKAVKAITNIKIENLTILSIFTGIVMSGMGMLSLASNLFSGLSSENFYGLLAIGCFCGALIVLLVYIMIRYIGKIVFSADKGYENKIDWFIIVTTFLLVIFFCFFIHKYKF